MLKMTTKCKKCGVTLEEDEPQQNGMCIDCFAEEWGELVEISPIASPRILLERGEK
jgi:NMD protein affecting ribosome stability and mRNA decay